MRRLLIWSNICYWFRKQLPVISWLQQVAIFTTYQPWITVTRNGVSKKSWALHLCLCWKNSEQGWCSCWGLLCVTWGLFDVLSARCGSFEIANLLVLTTRIYRLSRRNSACQRMWNRSESFWIYFPVFERGILWWCFFPHGFVPLANIASSQWTDCSVADFFPRCRSAHVIVNVAGPYMLTQARLRILFSLSFAVFFLSISWLHRENFSWIAAAVVALTIAMLVVRFHGHIVAREVGKACAI